MGLARTLLLAVLGMMLIAPGPAGVHGLQADRLFEPVEGMSRIETRRYEFFHDLEYKAAVEIGLHMDAVHAEFDRRMKRFGDRKSTRSKLFVLSSRGGYLDLLRSWGIDGTGSGAMFVYRGNGSALVSYTGDRPVERVFATLQHEGFHQFAWRRLGETLPMWANEGLAEYFERGRVERGRFVTGYADEEDVQWLREVARAGRLLPAERVLTVTNREWNAEVRGGSAGLLYQQSWAMIHFLVHGDRGKFQPFLLDFLKKVAAGMQADQAFRSAFKTDDYTLVDRRFGRFIERELQQGRAGG